MSKSKYIATVGLTNDKTGKRFKAGDTVNDSDFTKKQIIHLLKRGRLEEATDGSDANDRKD